MVQDLVNKHWVMEAEPNSKVSHLCNMVSLKMGILADSFLLGARRVERERWSGEFAAAQR